MKGSFKYIIISCPALKQEVAIIAPLIASHDHCVDSRKNPPIAAGFFSIHDGHVTATGRSESLNLFSRPQDAAIICLTLTLSGVQGLTGPWPEGFGLTKPNQPEEVAA